MIGTERATDRGGVAAPRRIALIGYRGAGKSAVAQCLATELGWPVKDADLELETEAGRSIASIFHEDGEPAFRDLESRVLERLVALDRHVLALGGGVVLRHANRIALRSAFVVWLRAAPQSLWERMLADPSTPERRPNLTVEGGLAEIGRLLGARTPLYAACADRIVDTDGKRPQQIAREILSLF